MASCFFFPYVRILDSDFHVALLGFLSLYMDYISVQYLSREKENLAEKDQQSIYPYCSISPYKIIVFHYYAFYFFQPFSILFV